MSYSIESNFWSDCNNVEKPAHEKIYARVYSKLIEAGWKVEVVHDKERQKLGIDVIVSSADGKVGAYIDEKAREKQSTNTFGLELSNNYEWNGGKRTPGWFLDETKVTTHYMFYYQEGKDEYVMHVDAKKLKEKIYSIADRNVLLNSAWGDEMLSAGIANEIKGAFILQDKKRQEHGRFLILPLDFYRSLEGSKEFKL